MAAELGVSPATAAILARRGLCDVAAAREFLAAEERHGPELLEGIDAACELVLRHVHAGSGIVVFGDYDVDGVCSTAVAVRALRALGAQPRWRLPSRDEGYGLSEAAVRELAAAGAGLVVTVDCGVTAVEEIALARSLGLDVVVTDHHRPGGALPDCPVVHPALGDHPFEHLCGAAVALKLSERLRALADLDPAGADEDLDLAGLATLCDMVPLIGENRRIARAGLQALARTRKAGLRALMRVAALDPGDVDERAAGFRLGPRLNAAGRMGRADAALELLLAEDDARADEIARELDGLNHDRREAELAILGDAERQAAAQVAAAAIVVAGEGWHPGVVGIVASRLVERHRRPCVAIALDGDRGRGSGRSIAAYDLHAGLAASADCLLGYGGHRMAAGLEVEAGRVGELRAALAAHAGAALAPADLVAVQDAHAVVAPGDLTLDLAEELERLGPFGADNPAPVLVVPGARVEHVTAMGERREHARFTLAGGSARARGVAFRTSQRALAEAGAAEHDLAVSLERNRWNGAVEARVVLRSLTPTRAGRLTDLGAEPPLAEAVERELAGDPSAWWPAAEPRPGDAGAAPTWERHGEGLAGLMGDLLTSGESVLGVVADVGRRREGLERLVAGMATGSLAVVSWEALGADPGVAAPFAHVVAVDPPPVADGLALLAAWCGERERAPTVHLAWGGPERELALACWRDRLALRPALVALWRQLDAVGTLAGDELETALRGPGPHPRDGAHCGRLVRVLCELDLASWARDETGSPRLSGGAAQRTDLDRSPAHRAYAARLAAAESYLGAPAQRRLRAAG